MTQLETRECHCQDGAARGRSSQELLLPRCPAPHAGCGARGARRRVPTRLTASTRPRARPPLRGRFPPKPAAQQALDRKSTRLNSSHGYISYAVFCLKKKKTYIYIITANFADINNN